LHQRLTLFIFSLFFSPFLFAQETTIIADAQEMIRDRRAETLTLKGEVNVIFQQQHLLCDEAVVYKKTNMLVAKGNVVLQNARTTLRGERIELNYETNKGKIYNGVVTSGQVLLEAEVIEKVGEDSYIADDAYYTACTTCPASWGFTSSNVEAEMGGYAYISRPRLHLLQFPVLPLPYLVVPLNSKRQTGFLVPKPFSNRDGGFAVEQPFFWAIDRSHDATFSLINYEKRGLQGTANYRYVISPTSSGYMSTGYLRDRSVADDRFKNRWFFEYGHHYDLPEGYTQRTNLAIASDRKYAFDFFEQFLYNGAPALENSVSLAKSFENSLLTLEASYYLSQIEEPRGFSNDPSLHRLPEINYEINDLKVSDDLNLFFNLDAQYLNVSRRGLAFEHTRTNAECTTTLLDDNGQPANANYVEGICYPTALSDGQFVYGRPLGAGAASDQAYGDLIRTGQRLDLQPSFHAPFWVGNVFDIDPSVLLRYTQYSLGVPSDESQGYNAYPSRFYGQLGLDVRSDLNRVYNWNDETRLKHSILPEINLRLIPKIFQSEHNFFGETESLRYFRELQPIDDADSDWRNGGRGIQFDHRDRIIGQKFVNFALTNKVIKRDLTASNSTNNGYQRAFLFRVSQALDLHELRKGDDARAWQSLNTQTELTTGPFSSGLQTFTFPYHGRTILRANTRYNFIPGNFVQLAYSKNYDIRLNPPVDENTRLEFLTLSTGLDLPYVYFFGSVVYDLNTSRSQDLVPFQSWRVAMQITPPGSCWTVNAGVVKAVGNDSLQPSLSMEFQFSE
jgi:LPS-assembly protein